MKFIVTIYSPADNEEHAFEASHALDLPGIVQTLSANMEPGAWFKIERVS